MRFYGLLAAIAVMSLAIAGQASAVNWVLNPGFEDPLGSEWELVFADGSGSSFSILGQTAASFYSGTYGLQFQVPTSNNFTAHAYYKQVVSGLTPGQSYPVSAWLKFNALNVYNRPDKFWVYLQAIGGMGSLVAPAKGSNTSGWVQYSIDQTADANGQIEIRVGMNKYGTTSAKQCDGFIDDVVLEAPAIPEPGSMIALLSGLIGLGVVARRRR